jgi:hypothetical protein
VELPDDETFEMEESQSAESGMANDEDVASADEKKYKCASAFSHLTTSLGVGCGL